MFAALRADRPERFVIDRVLVAANEHTHNGCRAKDLQQQREAKAASSRVCYPEGKNRSAGSVLDLRCRPGVMGADVILESCLCLLE